MGNNSLADLLAMTEDELLRLQYERKKLVGSLDLQIEQLEAASQNIRQAMDLDMRTPETVAISHRSPSKAKERVVPLWTNEPTPAQLVLAYVKSNPGTGTIAVIDALNDKVTARGTKSPRKVVSSALYDLRKRRKLVVEQEGRLYVKEDYQ
ncbi:MAG: hypothetical protein IPM33_06010 [Phycisphaerales bacterium]|nr:hypothetical protein [Phycisphaerales bacterium]